MADEPEDLTAQILREIREMREEMRTGFDGLLEGIAAVRSDVAILRGDMAEARAELHALASLMGKVVDDVTEITLIQRSHGSRLNATDGRIAIVERHTGIVQGEPGEIDDDLHGDGSREK
jgi:hypothetical protein